MGINEETIDLERQGLLKRGFALQPHQQRVVQEEADLNEKIAKLEAFRLTDTYRKLDGAEQLRLDHQLGFMREYSRILGERIAAFAS